MSTFRVSCLISLVLLALPQIALAQAMQTQGQSQTTTPQVAAPVALIYNGPGVCEEGCADAAADVAKMAGLTPRFVAPDALDYNSKPADVQKLYQDVKVWIQPGGIGNEALYTMTDRMVDELDKFIKNGGGYVGFCAGAFMATTYIGRRGLGMDIFPGQSIAFPYWPVRYDLDYTLQEVNWNGKKRYVFLEGGPYLIYDERDKNIETIATFPSGAVAAARATYGKGRVYITGLHPEAPTIWTTEDNIKDPDGSDRDLAIEMIQWAAQR
ncbi:MAG: hypothetical protein JST80_03050 [Bdellovibrionales bacterium]|nr:hypothetical protein [Bdellovibrionales bacterium]